VDNNQTYYYKIKAIYPDGESDYSNVAQGEATGGYYIKASWCSSPPTIDGKIGSSEWEGVPSKDMTYPGQSAAVKFYAMNDGKYLYFAVDDKGNTSLDNNDGLGLLFDLNQNREWPSSAGNDGIIQLYWSSGTPEARFQPRYGKWPDDVHGGSWSTPAGVLQMQSVNSGHVQWEGRFDLNTSPIKMSPGGRIGLLIYSMDSGSGFTGTWPQETVNKLMSYTSDYAWAHGPFSYGDLGTTSSGPTSELSLSSASLDFGENATNKTFSISNSGTGTLTWSASASKSWISLSPTSGSGNATITVTVDRSGLSPGDYQGEISVTSNGGDGKVTVKMTVLPSGTNTWIKIDPPKREMRLNTSGSVEIKIEHVTDMGSFELKLLYDENIVQIADKSDVVLGPFLGSTGRTIIPVGPEIDNSNGEVIFGAGSFGNVAGPSGTGVLATVTWTAAGEGNSPLDLEDVKVSDVSGTVIAVNSSGGQIDVVSGFWADVDNDGDVDIIDIQLVASHWNSQLGDADYDPIYDLDNEGEGDGDIDVIDIQLVASWWNQELPEREKRVTRLAKSAPPLTLRLIPDTRTGTLELVVEGASGIGAFQFDLIFLDRAPSVSKIESGQWFRQSDRVTVLLEPDFSPSFKKVTFGAYSYGEDLTNSFEGSLMRISFSEELSSKVLLENVRFADALGHSMEMTSIENTLENGNCITPRTTSLMQNYPNPFNPTTEIAYTLAKTDHVMLNIYDGMGRLVRALVNEYVEAGQYRITWDGKNDSGEQLPTGIYLCRLVCGPVAESKKMLLLK